MKRGPDDDINDLSAQPAQKKLHDEFYSMLPSLLDEVGKKEYNNFRNALHKYNITTLDLCGRVKDRDNKFLRGLFEALLETPVRNLSLRHNKLNHSHLAAFYHVRPSKLEKIALQNNQIAKIYQALFLQHPAFVELLKTATMQEKYFLLSHAANLGYEKMVEVILKEPLDFGFHNHIFLSLSSIYRDAMKYINILRMLLTTFPLDPGSYVIHEAMNLNYVDSAMLLLQRPDFTARQLNSFLATAARTGHTCIVEHLLQNPLVDPIYKEVGSKSYAIAQPDVPLLLSERCQEDNVNIKLAAKFGHLDIVKRLLKDARVRELLQQEWLIIPGFSPEYVSKLLLKNLIYAYSALKKSHLAKVDSEKTTLAAIYSLAQKTPLHTQPDMLAGVCKHILHLQGIAANQVSNDKCQKLTSDLRTFALSKPGATRRID